MSAARKFKYIGISPRCEEERLAATNKLTGRYRARFPVNGRYTTKILKATTKREAIKESQDATGYAGEGSFASVVKHWIEAGCITKKQKWRKPSEGFQYEATLHANRLAEYFGNQHIDEVNRLVRCADYQSWCGRKYGTRAADKGAQTLSNIVNFALFRLELVELNFVRSNRDSLHTIKSPSRERMPESADVIHRLADYFLTESQNDGRALRSEVFGWLVLFQMFTGCRTSELLRLKKNAQSKKEPGYIEGGHLYLVRSKGGINPRTVIGGEFSAMLKCFDRWHADRFPKSKEYFPGPDGALDNASYSKAVSRAARKLNLPHITPHGFRAYYVTKRRREGVLDSHVAAEIGDTTVSLIATTYGEYTDGEKLHWLPKQGLPAWSLWQDQAAKIARIA